VRATTDLEFVRARERERESCYGPRVRESERTRERERATTDLEFVRERERERERESCYGPRVRESGISPILPWPRSPPSARSVSDGKKGMMILRT
jgi:hypothetical protein